MVVVVVYFNCLMRSAQRYMRYIPLKPQRLYCPNCEETHALPQNGTIKLYKEIRCPLDNFELVLFSLGNSATAQGKSFPLCPYCYSHPPSIEAAEEAEAETEIEAEEGGTDDKQTKKKKAATKIKMGCNQCEHPTCRQSVAFNGMCPCPNTVDESSGMGGGKGAKTCPGTLVLDINSKPNWKLACNECNTLLRFHANIHNIIPLPRRNCEECGTRIATFEFNKMHKSPALPAGAVGEEGLTGCIVCNDVLNGLTEIVTGRSVHLTLLRQIRFKRNAGGRGRGRGRGRGGRAGGKRGDAKMSFSDF
jgi:DNA topoisomerase III